MVEGGGGGEGVGRVIGRREHRGGVGLDQQTGKRDVFVKLAEPGVAGGEVGGVEGKVGAERGEGRDEFEGAAIGVEQESARG